MPHCRRMLATLAAGLVLAGPAWAVPTTSFTVSGQVRTPGSFDATALQALPQATQPVTYRAGGAPVSDTFTGPALGTVLDAAGGIITNPAVKNDLLRKYVIATGSDGYSAVISAGEISPRFGNKQDLIATSDTSNRLPSPDGFARIVATGDGAGGRYVSNLASITVASAPPQAGTGGGPTSQFALQGAVVTTMTFDITALRALAPHTMTVTYLAGAATVTDTFTGALLWDVLAQGVVQTNPGVKNDVLRKLVAATGSDGYQVDFALGELSPVFGNAPILVAYADTAGQIAASDGFARIVVPGDIAGGRYVSNLTSLTVFDGVTAVPEPGSTGCMAAALAGLWLARRRFKAGRAAAPSEKPTVDRLLAGLLAAAPLFIASPARAEDGLRLFAAGSLTKAMTAMLDESGLPHDKLAAPVFGPSGVLRERIEAGAPADILASADMAQPRRLAAARGLPVVLFARNSLCALAPAALGITTANLLDRMLDPAVKLGTSTPGADPGGDYAWAVFARAEAVHPGARAALEAKALKLVGGPDSRPLVAGKGQVEGVFLTEAADIMLGYCSGAAGILHEVPGLNSVALPPELTVGPAYGLVVLTDHPLAQRFALFVMSEPGQAILARYGFRPVGLAD